MKRAASTNSRSRIACVMLLNDARGQHPAEHGEERDERPRRRAALHAAPGHERDEQERRDDEQQIDRPQRHALRPAAEVGGERADDRGDRRRQERDGEADQQRSTEPVQRQREHVPPRLRGAEEVIAAGRLQERRPVDVVHVPGREHRAEHRQRDEREQHHGAGDGGAVPGEAPGEQAALFPASRRARVGHRSFAPAAVVTVFAGRDGVGRPLSHARRAGRRARGGRARRRARRRGARRRARRRRRRPRPRRRRARPDRGSSTRRSHPCRGRRR